ncbi:hypothetical protein CASFOL_017901 [Castilleja foliolosa]|uniref:Replication factor A C-terminal domain-containing protein n=1 Tax=Castilleja foliolosa TaxID=1961234 RepID=A0ABD3DCC3_9LAMI
MASSLSFLQEFHEMYSEISTGKAIIRSLRTLKELREVEGNITGVDTNREFCYLACHIRGKKVEEVDGKKRCMYCGEYTFRDIFRYNVEVVVADETDNAKLIMWNRASEKLIGEPAEDGDTARTMPDDIAEKFLGRERLFEVIISSEQLYVDSRLTVDEEINDVYIMKNFPDYESNSEYDSFLQSLYYVEKDNRAVNKSVQADDQVTENATKETANEFDSDAIQTKKKQKREGTDIDK